MALVQGCESQSSVGEEKCGTSATFARMYDAGLWLLKIQHWFIFSAQLRHAWLGEHISLKRRDSTMPRLTPRPTHNMGGAKGSQNVAAQSPGVPETLSLYLPMPFKFSKRPLGGLYTALRNSPHTHHHSCQQTINNKQSKPGAGPMAAATLEYLPFVVLMFVSLSIRLDRASFRNSLSVFVGTLTLWVISPAQSPWGKAVSLMLLGLAIAMTPLGALLLQILKPVFLRTSDTTSAGPEHQVTGVTSENPKLINKLADPPDADVE